MEELLHNLGIKWQLLLAQIVNFLILLFLLKKFLYKPMLKFMRERRETIERGLKKSELAEIQFQEFRKMQAEQLTKTRTEAQKIMEDAKKRAEEAKAQILEEAKIQAEILFSRANKDIELLKNHRLMEAEHELGKMAVQGMEYLLREKISDDKKRELADEAIKNMRINLSNSGALKPAQRHGKI
ncbi:MAG: ATP synthase F0 subunit B [Candidatus Spechtbacteria bacterium RIFCSPHIGHO2_02_FULL_43_15b]|nr:MAG: ATP synthase F0 subunit B [Candidatus Spechtbacteria bacterium RIFCSPHIGHO2_02_FULL_43_15b]